MALKLIVPGVVPAAIPQYPDHVAAWKAYDDPKPGWYKMFSSMQYSMRRVMISAPHPWTYVLTPVVGRPVYTFDTWGDFIEASRQFTVSLFTDDFTPGVAMYRCHVGPPREHTIYRLPPHWTWNDDVST